MMVYVPYSFLKTYMTCLFSHLFYHAENIYRIRYFYVSHHLISLGLSGWLELCQTYFTIPPSNINKTIHTIFVKWLCQ